LLPTGVGVGSALLVAVLIVAAIWGFSGFYRVQPDEQGVVLRFGAWTKTSVPGLHYHLPSPFESVETPKVTTVHREEVGFRTTDASGTTSRNVGEEALMLTGDENIIDVNFSVFWRISDAGAYLFNIESPDATVKAAAEAAMREVIGQTTLVAAQTGGRLEIEVSTRNRLQEIMDEYGAGIEITEINLQKSDPPGAVLDAYRDVQRARADMERVVNEAEAYRNDVVPRARGEAAQIQEAAEAYREQIEAQAEGEAERFLSVYREYAYAPEVTMRRIYIETMEEVFRGANKVLVDQAGGSSGVIPYLPLPELQRRLKEEAAQ
jgi:membrane protease subunit HflK